MATMSATADGHSARCGTAGRRLQSMVFQTAVRAGCGASAPMPGCGASPGRRLRTQAQEAQGSMDIHDGSEGRGIVCA